MASQKRNASASGRSRGGMGSHNKTPSLRTLRVATLVREALAEILLYEVKDPRVAHVTLVDAELTPDLREARVFYVVSGDLEDQKRIKTAQQGLEQATGFLQRELGKRIDLRVTPLLRFFFDRSFEYGANIDRKLHELGFGVTPASEALVDLEDSEESVETASDDAAQGDMDDEEDASR